MQSSSPSGVLTKRWVAAPITQIGGAMNKRLIATLLLVWAIIPAATACDAFNVKSPTCKDDNDTFRASQDIIDLLAAHDIDPNGFNHHLTHRNNIDEKDYATNWEEAEAQVTSYCQGAAHDDSPIANAIDWAKFTKK